MAEYESPVQRCQNAEDVADKDSQRHPAPILRFVCAALRFWPVNDFLSVIVPIRNAEGTLTRQIGQLLEVLPDSNRAFEIILVDDGSTDHTVEIARDLACEYPQLRFIRHAEQRGVLAAINTGSQWAQGRTLVVHESTPIRRPADLQRAWRTTTNREFSAVPRTTQPAEERTAQGRTDVAHKSLRSSRHVNAFLSHLRTLALGE